jgi:hypothetical protein
MRRITVLENLQDDGSTGRTYHLRGACEVSEEPSVLAVPLQTQGGRADLTHDSGPALGAAVQPSRKSVRIPDGIGDNLPALSRYMLQRLQRHFLPTIQEDEAIKSEEPRAGVWLRERCESASSCSQPTSAVVGEKSVSGQTSLALVCHLFPLLRPCSAECQNKALRNAVRPAKSPSSRPPK